MIKTYGFLVWFWYFHFIVSCDNGNSWVHLKTFDQAHFQIKTTITTPTPANRTLFNRDISMLFRQPVQTRICEFKGGVADHRIVFIHKMSACERTTNSVLARCNTCSASYVLFIALWTVYICLVLHLFYF